MQNSLSTQILLRATVAGSEGSYDGGRRCLHVIVTRQVIVIGRNLD